MDHNIPKIIHYCWFGGEEKPTTVVKYINNWKKKLPEYKFYEWNETTFNINKFQFTEEAHRMKKFAFVSDVVRLYALYQYGGIYLDTDVEVIKSFDDLLENQGFAGFEDEAHISTAIIGARKGNKWIKEQLNYYASRNFISDDNELDMITNVQIISKNSTNNFGFIPNGKFQNLQDLFTIYPQDYFSPKSPLTGKIMISNNTYTVHHFSGTWVNKNDKRKIDKYQQIIRLFGKNNADKLLKLYKTLRN